MTLRDLQPGDLVHHVVYGERIVCELLPDDEDPERDDYMRVKYGDGVWTVGPEHLQLMKRWEAIGDDETVGIGERLDVAAGMAPRYFSYDELIRKGWG